MMEQEPPWPELELLRHEKDTLGFYLSGHPIEAHRALIQQLCQGTIKTQIDARNGPQLIAGWVTDLRRIKGRVLLTLDDRSAQITCIVGEDLLVAGAAPRKDTLLFVTGRISPDDFTGGWRIFANDLHDLETVQARYAERLLLKWPADMPLDLNALGACLTPLRQTDGCPVTVHYINGKAAAKLDLGGDWRIRVRDSELAPLRRLVGEKNLKVVYRRPTAPMGGE